MLGCEAYTCRHLLMAQKISSSILATRDRKGASSRWEGQSTKTLLEHRCTLGA